jgi:hypothetical protein
METGFFKECRRTPWLTVAWRLADIATNPAEAPDFEVPSPGDRRQVALTDGALELARRTLSFKARTTYREGKCYTNLNFSSNQFDGLRMKSLGLRRETVSSKNSDLLVC